MPLVPEVSSLGGVMRARGLVFVLCVVIAVCVGAERLSSEEERIVKSARTSRPRFFYIYPRSGRLFHADYVRDNEVFKSLERTNFMRRGPFANRLELIRTKRDAEEESVVKKHTYVDAGRIPGGKKSVLGKVKDVPLKVLSKQSEFTARNTGEFENRIKRESKVSEAIPNDHPVTTQNKLIQSSISKENIVKDIDTERPQGNAVSVSKEETIPKETENKVEGDQNTHTKNNDTDKTLFVLDSIDEKDQSSIDSQVPEFGLLREGLMKKLVLEDGMRLYPVYTGVKYTYPRVERSLQYAPEMTVQMDNPEVTDYVSSSESNSTTDLQEEGRGRRRRIKKLAFPLLLALKLKAAVMLPIILGLISLVAFKGLWSGLTALGVAAALGLKALVGSGAPRVVVQAPPPPHYHHPPPHEYAEYWSRRDDFSDYRPSSWS